MHRFSIVFIVCSLLSFFACAQAPQGKTGPSTDVKKSVSNDLDHSAFDALLKQVVKGDRVDYAGLVGDQRLVKYIETIAATNPETLPSDDARLAFYINAYNALTLQSVLTHWPTITSVSTIKPDFAFFKEEVHTIGGKKVSLDAIENKIIRPTFKRAQDPRSAELREYILSATRKLRVHRQGSRCTTQPGLHRFRERCRSKRCEYRERYGPALTNPQLVQS